MVSRKAGSIRKTAEVFFRLPRISLCQHWLRCSVGSQVDFLNHRPCKAKGKQSYASSAFAVYRVSASKQRPSDASRPAANMRRRHHSRAITKEITERSVEDGRTAYSSNAGKNAPDKVTFLRRGARTESCNSISLYFSHKQVQMRFCSSLSGLYK